MDVNTPLAKTDSEIIEGLTSDPRYIPSKYFYDDKGSVLFQQIMQMPEYYLTNTELDILRQHRDSIVAEMTRGATRLNLIELGAGDGMKTRTIIDALLRSNKDFSYIPVDISHEAIDRLSDEFTSAYPQLKINPLVQDYESGLHTMRQEPGARNIVLFLGSTIGNFTPQHSEDFLRMVNRNLKNDDMLFIGFDMVKDPDTILKAYNDAANITAKFNYNLLHRINRELKANFNVDCWRHQPVYDVEQKAAKSYLIATKAQKVYFAAADMSISFGQWDFIFTEISQKYNSAMIEQLALRCGFYPYKSFTDVRNHFTDALWIKK
jgi:dimethylhistidine N-methyltransferase